MNFINEIATWLNQSPMLNLIFVLLALVGLISSIIFYLKSKKEIIPCFRTKSFQIISDNISNIEDIDVLFKGNKVTNLTTTKVAFWNEGKATLDRTDVAIKDPLFIVIDGDTRILKAQVIFQTKEANNFEVNLSDNNKNVGLNFDYLDTKDGVIIELFHTGNSELHTSIKGSIKGVSRIYEKTNVEAPITSMILEAIIPKWMEKLFKYNEWLAKPFIIFYLPIILPFTLIDMTMSLLRKVPEKFNI